MNKEIFLRILKKKLIFKKNYIFIIVSISLIFQLMIFIFFVFKYNLNYLINKLSKLKEISFKKNQRINMLETKESNSLLKENSNPPKKNKAPRNIFKNKEDNLCIIKNSDELNNTINFKNIELNINESYRECYESFKGENIFITISIKDSKNNSSKIISNSDIDFLNDNEIENNKSHSISNFLKKYVPFINIYIFNDLNIYILKLSLFLFWLNLLFFFNIIFQYLYKNHNYLCEDYNHLSFKKLNVLKLFFSSILSIIFLFFLDLLCFTDYNIYKVLINEINKKKFINYCRIKFSIYYILMLIFYILIMYLSYKRYDKCLEQKDQKIDIFHFSIEIVMSIFIYLVILPFFYFLYYKK